MSTPKHELYFVNQHHFIGLIRSDSEVDTSLLKQLGTEVFNTFESALRYAVGQSGWDADSFGEFASCFIQNYRGIFGWVEMDSRGLVKEICHAPSDTIEHYLAAMEE